MVLPCLPLLIICTISATALQVVWQVVFILLIFTVSVKLWLPAPDRAVPTLAAFVSLLSAKNNCCAFRKIGLHLNTCHKSYFIWQPTALLVFCHPMSSIGGFGWCWDVCLKTQIRWSVCQLLPAPNVLPGLWVEISHFEFAGIHNLNVVQSGDNGVILFWNEKQGVLAALLGQKRFPILYIAKFSKPIYHSSLLT